MQVNVLYLVEQMHISAFVSFKYLNSLYKTFCFKLRGLQFKIVLTYM